MYAPRPVRPGTLAVRQDWQRHHSAGWAIVSAQPMAAHTKLKGHLRGAGESHAGLYVYPFFGQRFAARAARDIMFGARAMATSPFAPEVRK